MKKSLLGLLIALLTFFGGVFAAKIYLVKYQFISAPPIEAVKVEEIQTVKTQDFVEPKKNFAIENKDYGEIYGWYSLENQEKMPEVNMIKLSSEYANNSKKGKIILSAGIYTELSEDIDEGFAEGIQPTIEGNKVKFKTKKLKGIEYHFEGFFFKNKTSGENGEEILRGTLQKYIKGKKVAQMSGDFAYYKPYCLH